MSGPVLGFIGAGPVALALGTAFQRAGLPGGMGGCVARGDVGTVRTHLSALDELGPEHGALYRALAARTVPLAIERGTLSPDRASEIGAVLETRPQD